MARVQQLVYFKKGCPTINPDFKAGALKKHEKALTASFPKRLPPVDDEYWFSYYMRLDRESADQNTVCAEQEVKERARAIVNHVFRDYKDPEHWWTASTSASYDSTQDDGGAASEIGFSFGDDFEFVEVSGKNAFRVIVKVSSRVYPELKLTKRIQCRPVALEEPLKCRVITAESAWASYALKGAQTQLWKCLKKFPWFRLTGRPCTASDIPIPGIEQCWISVDYSAATDNLSSWITKYLCKLLEDVVGLPYELMFESLCEHQINYGTRKVPRLEEQKNGQLMGSILSFIVLCLANATVLSLTVDPYELNLDSEILINGDDGLFLGNATTFKRWSYLSSNLGLTPSVGKTYVSKAFCVINSQLYMREGCMVKEVGYSNNASLTFYDAKSGSRRKTPGDLASSYEDYMCGTHAFDLKTRVDYENLWYRSLMDTLKENQHYACSWYAPKWAGGYGIPLPVDGSKNDAVLEGKPLWRFLRLMKRLSNSNLKVEVLKNELTIDEHGDYSVELLQLLESIGLSRARLLIVDKIKDAKLCVDDRIRLRGNGTSALSEFMTQGLFDSKSMEELAHPWVYQPGDVFVKKDFYGRPISLRLLLSIKIREIENKVVFKPKIPNDRYGVEHNISPYRRWLMTLISSRESLC
jgi:hypothetical protein